MRQLGALTSPGGCCFRKLAHAGAAAYDKLWSKLVNSAARVVAATLPEALEEQAKLKLPANSTFEVSLKPPACRAKCHIASSLQAT